MAPRRALVALVSTRVRDELRASVAAADLPLEFVVSNPAVPVAPADLGRVNVAFMSIDIVGESSGTRLAPSLATFFEQVRAATNLRWLHVCSAGADRPVFTELMSRGVTLTTSSGANAAEVSHTAIAGFLALARGLPAAMDSQRRHEWAPLKGARMPPDIEGQTAVLVGLGPIGREIARLLSAFGVHVIGVRRSSTPVPGCAQVVALNQIDAVLPQAQWIVLACPLTPDTLGLIDARRLALLPPGARLINVARGAVVVEEALVDALTDGTLAGAFLDVFATEPLPSDSPLWDLPNTVVSPHSAGYSGGLHGRTVRMFLENLKQFAIGGELRNAYGR